MSTTKSRRLSNALKKQLQANLESLTAEEVGQLLVTYAHEADQKNIDLADYRPLKELWKALAARVQRARGKPEENAAVLHHRGVVLLSTILTEVNSRSGFGRLQAYALEATALNSRLSPLLELGRAACFVETAETVLDEGPIPLSHEEYNELIAWSQDDAFMPLKYAAAHILRHEFAQRKQEKPSESELLDILEAKLNSGELVGGDGVLEPGVDAYFLITDGTIPAWVALRLVWRSYIASCGLQEHRRAYLAPLTEAQIRNNNDWIGRDGLRKLVLDFYNDCRHRPWGKDLAAQADPDALANLLSRSAISPIWHHMPDLGRVNWTDFQKSEVSYRGEPFEAERVATRGSLNQLDPNLRSGLKFSDVFRYQEWYYASQDDRFWRGERFRLFEMLERLGITHYLFNFKHEDAEMLTLSDLSGVRFLSPLEQQAVALRRLNSELATLKHTFGLLSERFFGGLLFLLSRPELLLRQTEEQLQAATLALNTWVAEMAEWPWSISVSELRIGEPEIIQDLVDEITDEIVGAARSRSRVKEPEALLFRRR